MANFPAASEAENPQAHTEKTHLLCQSLSCSHFRRPISSVKLQTNFLGMPFKMIHPHFQSIFPISYWDLSLFVAEGRFSVRTASLSWSPLVCSGFFSGFLREIKLSEICGWLICSFTSFPENATLHSPFPDSVFPLSQLRWLHWFEELLPQVLKFRSAAT